MLGRVVRLCQVKGQSGCEGDPKQGYKASCVVGMSIMTVIDLSFENPIHRMTIQGIFLDSILHA